MIKIKVIDLLNKIANGEEVPKKIKIYGSILRLNENKDNYLYEDSDEYYGDEFIHWFKLNDEVEIIEEDKKIEKMMPLNNVSGASDLVAISQMQWDNNLKIERKINEIIDYLEENK